MLIIPHDLKGLLLLSVGKALSPAKKTSHSGNPWVSVLISWFLVQVSGDELMQSDGHHEKEF